MHQINRRRPLFAGFVPTEPPHIFAQIMKIIVPGHLLPSTLLVFFFVLSTIGCKDEQPVLNQRNDRSRIQRTETVDRAADRPEPIRPSDSWQHRIGAVSKLLSTGKIDSAEQAIRSLLIEAPDDLAVNSLMLRVLVHRKQIDVAVDLLDRMAQLHPNRRDDMEAHAANLLHEAGHAKDAISRLKKLIQRTPDFADARRRLAQILNQQGYAFDSNEHFRILMRDNVMARDELVGLVFPFRSWNASEQPASDSVDDRDNAGPKQGILSIAMALNIKGRPREALAMLDNSQLISQNQDPAAIATYGQVLANAQMYEELRRWIATAPKECQRYPNFWIACGNLARHERNHQVSVDCFVEAIIREPHSVEAHHGAIESLEASGQRALAEKFRLRSYVLDQICRDVKEIRDSQSPKPDVFIAVATNLMGIGRPLEAIAWQELAIATISPTSNKLQQIPGFKKKVLAEYPTGNDENVILCETDRNSAEEVAEWLALRKQDLPELSSGALEGSMANRRDELPVVIPVLRNRAKQTGLQFRYKNAPEPVERLFLLHQALGGGVACLDFDHDGHVDFYFGQGSATPPDGLSEDSNGLFRNLKGRFANVIDQSGADDRRYTLGVTAGDWNQDGFADLLIGNLGANRLLINQGDGTFEAMENDSISLDSTFTTSLAIADVTGDSLPDIIEVNYVNDEKIFDPIQFDSEGKPTSLPGPLVFEAAMDRLLVSTGDGSSQVRPLGGQTDLDFSPGLALIVTDLDGRQGNEIFVANDMRANQLWTTRHSDGDEKQVVDMAVASGVAYGNLGRPAACMGIAAADYDQNGLLDLHICNFENEWSNQFMQTEPGMFVDSTVSHKLDSISRKMLGFGVQAIDYENDMRWDLIVGNGHIEDLTAEGSRFEMPTQLLAGRNNSFQEQKVSGDDEYWRQDHLSRALAKCDYNRDGKVDVVATDLKQNAALLENQTATENHWLQLVLVGTNSERDSIGASVVAVLGSQSFSQTVQTGDGYLAKNEPVLFFGLGPAEKVDQLQLTWPSGLKQTLINLPADTRWLVVEGDSEPWRCE